MKKLLHPVIGSIELSYEVLHLPDSSLAILCYQAEPGSAEYRALQKLAG